MREEINKLEEEIRNLCKEVYGQSGDEMMELIEELRLCDTSKKNRNTISVCKMYIEKIKKDRDTVRKKC